MKNYSLLNYMMLALLLIALTGSSIHTNALTIVALGDSLTYGTGDPLKIGYVGRFKEQFEQDKKTPLQVYNYGIPGYTTENTLEQLKDEKIKKDIQHSNYILLYIGTNDFRKSAEYKFDPIHLKKMNVGRTEFSKNLHQILEKIRYQNASAPIIVMGLYNPYLEYKNHKQILALINNWNTEITEVASLYDPIVYVPTLDLFENKSKKRYFSDSLHPNAAGYELISNRLLEKMMIVVDTNS